MRAKEEPALCDSSWETYIPTGEQAIICVYGCVFILRLTHTNIYIYIYRRPARGALYICSVYEFDEILAPKAASIDTLIR